MITATKWNSWCTGKLAKGCRQCVEGRKLVLFITGLCGQGCFYCPVSEQKYGKDVVFANEWKVNDPCNPTELFEEIKLTEACGAGITGGDPLVKTDRCCEYIKKLKEKFGKFHVHLYTPLRLVTPERLKKLYEAGLDEIRFHPNLDDTSLWERIELARLYDWEIGIEIPVIPGYGDRIKKLIDFVAGKIHFVNLNELERADTQTKHYLLDKIGFVQKDEISYGIKGSKELAIELLKYANQKGLNAHFCTAKLKDGVQMKQRIIRRARNVALPFDKQTKEGLLLRGCLYLPSLVPGIGYREKLAKANQEEIRHLKEVYDILKKEYNVQVHLDEKKFRLILPPDFVKANAQKLNKKGVIPAIVEEYPTADGFETTIDFL